MSTDFLTWEEAVSWLREQPDQRQLVADCYYDSSLIQAAQRYHHSEEWAAIRTLLNQPSGHVLDIGAGRGIASYAFVQEGFSVAALEPDPSNLVGRGAIRTLAVEHNLPISVVEGFSEHLPFPDAEFEIVFARAALHHTQDLEQACQEFFRVLKPEGQFIAVREHVINHPKDLPCFFERHPLHKLYGGENAFLLNRYTAALKHAGFAGLKILSPWRSPINYAPYTLPSLQAELSHRVSLGIPIANHIAQALFHIPGVWPWVRNILELIDRRPGRLYSFVAEKR